MPTATQRRAQHQQDDFISYGLTRLGFTRYIERPYIGFKQMVNTLAQYEQYRHAGLCHRDAVDCLLYGDGWVCLSATAGTSGSLDGDL